jgi:glyoxylase-like metal-dependent hydrolase (beta-lactamase superfamily II)
MRVNPHHIILSFVLLLQASSGFAKTQQDKKHGADRDPAFVIILPGLYRFQDAANSYLLKSGSSAILFDAGSRSIPAHLKEIGVSKVDWVLHTHYHRDQCLGDGELKQAGASIAIGLPERDLLEPAGLHPPFMIPDKFLLDGELPGWGRRMAPFQPAGVDRVFGRDTAFTWKNYSIRVMLTPGHTGGSVSYFITLAGKTVGFSGDLIVKGGFVHDLFSMQWTYLENPGIDSSLFFLSRINGLAPDLLLPSHGDILDDPQREISVLDARLRRLQNALRFERAGRWNWSGFVQITPHVIQDCGTTTQIILSERGDALLFDCGNDFTTARLEEAKIKFGIKKVSVIIPSHWHYDHVNGIPGIAKSEGAEVWAYEGLAEHLEYPWHFPTTCWSGITVKPDRVLKEGEEFEWGNCHFKVYPNPVHMEEQMALGATIDELGFLFIGDGTSQNKESHIRSAIYGYNGISLSTGLISTSRSFYEANPYICVPAHSNGFATFDDTRDEFLDWAVNTTDAIMAILPPVLPEMAFNPYWATFYPARVRIRPGEEVTMALRLKNPGKCRITGRFRLKSYGNIRFGEDVYSFELKPGETKDISFKVKVSPEHSPGIHIITADILCNDEFFAEIPQGFLEED